jgi:hypothetical protein
MNLANIQRMAANLQPEYENYEGDQRTAIYTGYNDDLVDFDGQATDFANEVAGQRTFTLTFTNLIQTGVKYAGLSPAYIHTYAAGNINGAPIATGVMVTDTGKTLTAQGTPKAIEELTAFLADNPARLVSMKIVSNNADQLAQMCIIKQRSPFRNLEDSYLNLADYTVETSNNDKMLTLKGLQYQFDKQTEFLFPIVPSADGVTAVKTTITLKFGAVLNTAAALNKKAYAAGHNPRVQQGRMVAAGIGI